MTIYNKEWLKSTNDFALLGIRFLYISNAGAIIAILANIHHLTCHPNYPAVSCALTMFVLGIVCSLAANFFGYLIYHDMLVAKQNQRKSKNEVIYLTLGIYAAVFSFIFFVLGAFKAISVIG